MGWVDRLGYLRCSGCRAVPADDDRAVSGPPHADEKCDTCGRPLRRELTPGDYYDRRYRERDWYVGD